jgi:hypothetical protein
MKNLLTLILLLIFLQAKSQTPDWEWARSGGSVSNDYSNATCTDANGNVYITGTFQGSTITFGSDTLQNSAAGTLDIFIAKYDASGNVLWARSEGGIGDDYAYGIAVDLNGNVYITGYFRSRTIVFGTDTLSNTDTTTSGLTPDIFTAKYNSIGNEQWAKSAGNSDCWEASYAICTDTDSNVYITGMYGYGTSMIFGSDTLINRGAYDIFLAKYNAGGNLLWVRGIGGISYDYGISICFDGIGSLYVTGYQYQAVFGSDTLSGELTVFVAKFDTDGNSLWAKNAIGPNLSSLSIGTGITTYLGSNVYITGYFRYSVSFGNDTLSNAGQDGIFVAGYDSSGNALWGRSPGGTNYDYSSNSICTNASGNAFITGYFSSPFLNFGGQPVINTNAGYDDIYVAEYDANGNALWATNIGGQGHDYGMGICSSPTINDVYVTGYFGSYAVNFGTNTVTNNGSYDIFLAKLSTLAGVNEQFTNGDNIPLLIYPNPSNNSTTLTLQTPTDNLLQSIYIYSTDGRLLKSIGNCQSSTVNLDVKDLSAGIYFIKVSSESGVAVRRFVKQ